MPIRWRITLAFALTMAAVLAGAGWFLATRLAAEQKVSIDANLDQRAAVIVRDVNEEFHDVGKDDGVLDEAEKDAWILGPDGRELEAAPRTVPTGRDARVETWSVTLGSSRQTDRFEITAGGHMRYLAHLTENGSTVFVGASMAEADASLNSLRRSLIVGAPLVLALSTFLVWLLAGAALRPVERMRGEAEALSFDSGDRRLDVPATRDEIARLGTTLNAMLERIEGAVERERRFVDDASHELRTPLAALKTELELALRRTRSTEELQRTIRSAAEEVDTLVTLAEQLLVLARADRGVLTAQRSRTDLAHLAVHVREVFAARAHDRGVEIDVTSEGDTSADVDPVLVRQALANLVANAIAHTPSGGRVVIEPTPTNIAVTDSGPGFDEALLPRVFEPFTRSDGARTRGDGTGLGLAIVDAIARAHGGEAEATNPVGGGARVVLRLS